MDDFQVGPAECWPRPRLRLAGGKVFLSEATNTGLNVLSPGGLVEGFFFIHNHKNVE